MTGETELLARVRKVAGTAGFIGGGGGGEGERLDLKSQVWRR